MYLYGASGHAKVIMEILNAGGVTIDKVFDDNPAVQMLLHHPVSGFHVSLIQGAEFVVSIGNNNIRKTIVEKLNGARFASAIHPFTSISPTSTLGKGSVVMAGVCINSDTRIGNHCIVNTKASIDHDCLVDDFVHIAPGSVLCGNVKVGEGTLVGAGSVIIPGVKIGKWCTIGAGSVIIRDIPDFSMAVGNPCQVIKTSVSTS